MTELPISEISISVIVICHNQADTIEAAVSSVLDQTDQMAIHEIIIVDDGSSDASPEIIAKIARRDHRIVHILRTDSSGGAATPRNDGISHASGSHLAFLDGDDVWMPEKISIQKIALLENPGIGLLFSDYYVFDDETEVEERHVARNYTAGEEDTLKKFFVYGGPAVPSCAIISRKAAQAVGFFAPDLRFNEENDFWLRIAASFPIHHQPHALIRKREWFGSLGSAKYRLENLQCKREITRRMVDLEPSLLEVVPARESQIEYKAAIHFFGVGDLRKARGHLRKAIQLNRRAKRPRLLLALSFLPGNPEKKLQQLRRVRSFTPASLR